MAKKQDLYQELFTIARKTKVWDSIYQLLEWDQETYMPKDGLEIRSEQIEMLSHLIHTQQTSSTFAKALGRLIDPETGEIFDESLTFEQRTALREWRRDYLRHTKLPKAFVTKLAKTTSQAKAAWQEAKSHNDFKHFAPHLKKIVSLMHEQAGYLGYDHHPYDALIDLYEPEMTTERLTPLFGKLQLELTTLMKKIAVAEHPPADFLFQEYPTNKQLAFGKRLFKDMGFESTSARLDHSAHPFCLTVCPDDIRMTTWVHPENLPTHIFAVLHEGGHGLYEHHLPKEHFGSPLCEAASYGIHESQSRFWEVFIGQSTPFWQHYYPILQHEFPAQLGHVKFEAFVRAINQVKPSLIRVEADEVSYCLHVILRYEIEKALMEGHLQVEEIPEVWNDKMRAYLGAAPTTDDKGCLQDVHWSCGGFGYFCAYALGNIYAAQFFKTFQEAHPNWEEQVAKGHLLFISDWLKTHVHQWGRQFVPEVLVEKATGSPLTPEPYLDYLNNKFKTLYRI